MAVLEVSVPQINASLLVSNRYCVLFSLGVGLVMVSMLVEVPEYTPESERSSQETPL